MLYSNSFINRSNLLKEIRNFFWENNYHEVETPILVGSPGLELNIEALSTHISPDSSGNQKKRFLHTSPEFGMKKIYSSGMPRIFQIAKVFRDKEISPLHKTEFTLLEWYRQDANSYDLMDETENLFAWLCKRLLDSDSFFFKNSYISQKSGWKKISVSELSLKILGFDITRYENADDLTGMCREMQYPIPDCSSYSETFNFIMADKFIPFLEKENAVFLTGYPSSERILAKLDNHDNLVSTRFELFIKGVEVANGWEEITDSDEILALLEKSRDLRLRAGLSDYGIDYELVQSFKSEQKSYSGIALGVDRLAMLLFNNREI